MKDEMLYSAETYAEKEGIKLGNMAAIDLKKIHDKQHNFLV